MLDDKTISPDHYNGPIIGLTVGYRGTARQGVVRHNDPGRLGFGLGPTHHGSVTH
jgi:hypothetical protein